MIKKATTILAVIILMASSFLIVIGPTQNARAASSGEEEGENDLDLDKLEKGDIVVVSGGPLSKIVPGRWTHAMMYIGDGEVIESVKDGVEINDAEMINDREKAAIYRVDTDLETKEKAIDFAMDQLGKSYDYTWWSKDVYDSSYYCSELIWASYYSNGVDIDENPGWSWSYAYGVAPTELADDGDTVRIAYGD
ncbi:MAG: YiiX/YebB-like N1pC/P60 family cysteine hydrolase [Thermoplasmata archaeon]